MNYFAKPSIEAQVEGNVLFQSLSKKPGVLRSSGAGYKFSLVMAPRNEIKMIWMILIIKSTQKTQFDPGMRLHENN